MRHESTVEVPGSKFASHSCFISGLDKRNSTGNLYFMDSLESNQQHQRRPDPLTVLTASLKGLSGSHPGLMKGPLGPPLPPRRPNSAQSNNDDDINTHDLVSSELKMAAGN